MNIKSLLLGSAAALAVVSGAQAADAIVAAEPEPMEYVRVCDAFGTGYFYIPGTETCLKIGGEVRVGVSFGEDVSGGSSWQSNVRARLAFEAKNDSEIGTIGSYVRLEATNTGEVAGNPAVGLDQAYITVGGFRAGKVTTWLDDIGTASESDAFITDANFNTVSYAYASDAFSIGLGVDDLSAYYGGSKLGVEGYASATLGAASVTLWGAYDFEGEEGLVVGEIAAEVGPGTFELYAGYSSGANAYAAPTASAATWQTSEWTVGAAYAFKATEKLTITPSANYWGDVDYTSGVDAWGVGLLAEYALAQGLKTSATVDYIDTDGSDDGAWSGFVRLTRSF